MNVYLNGEQQELALDSSLAALVEAMGLGGQRIAVEVNQEIVPRSQYADHRLQEGDRVEVVRAIGGG